MIYGILSSYSVHGQGQRALAIAIVLTETGLRLGIVGFWLSIYFSFSIAAKMVSRDSRGEVDENNRWKSQIITRANSVGAISVLVDKLTPQVEAERGGGGVD